MEEMLIYQGKVAIAFMVFFIAFKVLFDSWKNFGFNRLYLLGSMILSFIVPLITFTIVREVAPTFVYFESSGNEIFIAPTAAQKEQINILQIILTLYFAGVIFFMARLLAGHVKAISIILKSRKMQENGIPLYIYPAEIHPFAFFSKVVVPENALKGKAFHMILKHEMVHIREKHWLDNLTSELLCAVQWFNPFAWMMKGALKRNLEFQADNKVVASHDAETYQMALVSMANTQGPGTFLTAINSTDLKTRIKMMKMKTENKYAVVKQLVVLPLLAILVMGLSNKVVKTEILPVNKTEIINGKIIKGKVTDEKGIPIERASVEVKGRQYGVITDLKGNYKIEIEPTDETLIYGYLYYDKKEVNIDGKTEIDVQLKTDGNPPTDGIPFDKSFRMRNSEGDLVKPLYIIDGKEFDIEKHQRLGYRVFSYKGTMLNDSIAVREYGEKGRNGVVILNSEFGKEGPLYIVDGVEAKSVDNLNPDDIEKIDVLKGESGFKHYGEKGKNGVVLIKTKTKYNSQPAELNIKPESTDKNGNPVFYKVDEMPEFPGGEMALLKYITNTTKYPEIARENGIQGKVYVSFIITKEGKVTEPSISRGVDPALDKEALRVISSLPDWKPGKQGGQAVNVSYTVPITFGLQNQNNTKGNPLFVIDGVISGNNSLKDINPETIQSIEVLKDKPAIDLYGEKGKNGVILITMKDKTTDKPTITNAQQLRRAIAERIKYPVSAQQAGQTGRIEIYAEINREGKINQISETAPAVPFETLDEVVIVAYASENPVSSTADIKKPLIDESKRVIQSFPKIEIPEIQGKWVKFQFNFLLQ